MGPILPVLPTSFRESWGSDKVGLEKWFAVGDIIDNFQLNNEFSWVRVLIIGDWLEKDVIVVYKFLKC